MTNTPIGDAHQSSAGYLVIDGLDDLSASVEGDTPSIARVAHAAGVTIVRIVFRAGQTMSEHRAARPIVLLGQWGEVDVQINGVRTRLAPGTAIHIDAHITHALTAATAAALTLLVLDRPAGRA